MDMWPCLNGELWHSVRRGRRGAHGDDSQRSSNRRALCMISSGVTSSYSAEFATIQPGQTDRWAQGLLVIGDVGCTGGGGDSTKHCT
jgi:cytosine/adenosine deaminase-related metal-dependent hydrolase